MTVVDVHTHLMWYPDHIESRTAEEALAAKLVKLERSGGRAHAKRLDLHCYDATPEDHWDAAQQADKVVVFGIQARPTGLWVPNDLVADHVRRHPERLEGWASVNPAEGAAAVEELERCVEDLGLRGLKVGPAYQHWDPRDPAMWPVFERCVDYGIPVVIHQGTTFPSRARLDYAHPLLLEPLVSRLPELRLLIAHMGHPWEADVVALIRKAPHVYADISALHYRPFRYWHALVTAHEYGVTHKLLLGSDFPSCTLRDTIDGLNAVNDVVSGSGLPRISKDVQHEIVHENWARFLGPDWATGTTH